jgi:hypothetical protein
MTQLGISMKNYESQFCFFYNIFYSVFWIKQLGNFWANKIVFSSANLTIFAHL